MKAVVKGLADLEAGIDVSLVEAACEAVDRIMRQASPQQSAQAGQ
jgi:hypothetical protein